MAKRRFASTSLTFSVASIQKLPLRGIRKFVVEEQDILQIPSLFTTSKLANMPNLMTRSLNNICISQFLKILRPPAHLLPASSSYAAPTPTALTLEVLEVWHPKLEPDRHAQEVLDMVEARANCGVPLMRLFFCSEHVPDGFIDGLSA